jgi:hypothetical protein
MKIIAFVIAMVFFLGGMTLLGYAFEPNDGAARFIMFFGGILAITVALMVPMSILKRIER